MRPNLVRQKLKAGEVVIGCLIGIPSPEVVELCGHSGFDFVLIDGEHGAISPATAYPMVLAAEATDTVPLIRVPHNEASIILRYLDIGAAGVMVPQVNSAADARAVVEAVKYYPQGRRGMAKTRAASYGFGATLSEYAQISNNETLVIAQIEDIVGVEKVPEILEVPGIDVLLIGPTDLAQSMGYPGQLDHPEVLATIARICDMCKGSDVALGTIATDAATTNRLIEQGFRVITPSASGIIAQWSRDYLADIKR